MNSSSQGVADERAAVIKALCKINEARFKVLSNLEKEAFHISGLFPDIILQDKNSQSALFIMEVRKNGGIATCMQQWKNVPKIPAVLYIIVPESDLANAKSIAQAVGLQPRLGMYRIETSGDVTIKYE